MRKYVIEKIYGYEYDRIMIVKRISDKKIFNILFVNYEKYIENTQELKSETINDIEEQKLFINFVCNSVKSKNRLMYEQPIKESPYIEAVVEVYKVLSGDKLYAITSFLEDKILISFETDVNYKEKERIYLEGELQIYADNESGIT